MKNESTSKKKIVIEKKSARYRVFIQTLNSASLKSARKLENIEI